ncbi:MAG: hypothetical protein AABW50_01515 [Nanoarchaeota archaeon]
MTKNLTRNDLRNFRNVTVKGFGLQDHCEFDVFAENYDSNGRGEAQGLEVIDVTMLSPFRFEISDRSGNFYGTYLGRKEAHRKAYEIASRIARKIAGENNLPVSYCVPYQETPRSDLR